MDNGAEEQKERQPLREQFREMAEAVSATVRQIHDFGEAVAYAVDLCGGRGGCRLAISGCEEKLSRAADGLCRIKDEKIIAAAGLSEKRYRELERSCANQGFTCLRSGLRSHLEGIDIGFTVADLAIAETGTVVLDCPGEDLRLSTMICEYHVCVVNQSRIVKDAFAAEARLKEFMSRAPGYTAFITGASRTADIERVLALGVHGPLEVHLLILED